MLNRLHSERKVLALIAGVLLTGATLPAQQAAPLLKGKITGIITDQNGTPISSVVVTVHVDPAGSATGSPQVFSAVTAKDGSYALSSLPAGNVRICMLAPAATRLLDPCTWTPAPSSTALAAGQTISMVGLKLQQGHPVTVRIDDPNGLLGESGSAPKGSVIVGFWLPNGLFERLHVIGSDANGMQLQGFVPYNTALALSVQSSNLALTDEANSPIDPKKGGAISFQVPTGTTAPVAHTFHVIGLQP
jgi:hypothetical protein